MERKEREKKKCSTLFFSRYCIFISTISEDESSNAVRCFAALCFFRYLSVIFMPENFCPKAFAHASQYSL